VGEQGGDGEDGGGAVPVVEPADDEQAVAVGRRRGGPAAKKQSSMPLPITRDLAGLRPKRSMRNVSRWRETGSTRSARLQTCRKNQAMRVRSKRPHAEP